MNYLLIDLPNGHDYKPHDYCVMDDGTVWIVEGTTPTSVTVCAGD